MDVIAHTRTIRCRVIITKDGQVLAPSYGDLRDIGHEIVRRVARIFTQQASFMRASGIEIAQRCNAPLGIGLHQVCQTLLDDELGAAIGIGHRQRRIFRDRHAFGFAIDGGGRTENQFAHAVLMQRAQQADRTGDVIVKIIQRLIDRIANRFQTCEMNHCRYFLALQQTAEIDMIANIQHLKRQLATRDSGDMRQHPG